MYILYYKQIVNKPALDCHNQYHFIRELYLTLFIFLLLPVLNTVLKKLICEGHQPALSKGTVTIHVLILFTTGHFMKVSHCVIMMDLPSCYVIVIHVEYQQTTPRL